MAPRKPSGSALASALLEVAPTAAPPAPIPAAPEAPRRGRPPSGGPGMAITLRLDPALYSELARLLPELATAGRPMPTVQDLLRAVAAGVADRPDLVRELWARGRDR